MIDWSKLAWTRAEMEGVAEIRLSPRIQDDLIAVQATWLDKDGNILRQDGHVHILQLPPMIGEEGTL